MLTILTLKMLLMIVYLAHWDWILTQSRKDIVSNINDSKFMAICPFDQNEIELGNYYKETIDWKLNRNKIFDFWGIKNLRNIIKLGRNSTPQSPNLVKHIKNKKKAMASLHGRVRF